MKSEKNMRKMKDSGIQWIGQIPENWKVTSLKRFVGVSDGTHDTPQYVDISENTYPLVTSKCIVNGKIDISLANHISNKDYDEINKRSKVNINDVIMPMIGTVGNPALVENITDFAIKNVALLRTNGSYELGKWVWYLLNSNVALTQFDLVIRGGVQNFISQEKLGKMIFPFCENNEMKNIVNFLDQKCSAIDSVLEKTKASIEEYKKLKQSVITQAVTKGIQPNRPMKDSGIEWIGQIPEDWKVIKFKYLAIVKSNLVEPFAYVNYPQVSPENIEKSSGKLLPCKTVKEVGVISDNHLFYKGQILYSKIRPKLNKVTIAPFDGLCSADMYPIETTQHKKFFLYALLSGFFLTQISFITEDRVKMPKINQEELGNTIFPIPPLHEQQAIADYLDTKCTEIDNLIAKKEQFLKEIETYKKSLIYEYVTGKKEV